jgi:outer membrane protein assembly factor BamB
MIIMCTAAHTVYAQFDGGPWPMFRQNPLHTGRTSLRGPSNPALMWSYRTGAVGFEIGVDNSPSISSDGRVYVGSDDSNLYSLSSSGGMLWSYKLGYYVISSPALGSDGRIYIGSEDNAFYCLSTDGTLGWSYRTGAMILPSTVIDSDFHLITASRDYNIYSFSSDASLNWSYSTADQIESSPVVDSDNNVYIGSGRNLPPDLSPDNNVSLDNNLYALDSNGELKWSYETGDRIRSSPAIAADGAVYVGSYDSRFYKCDPAGSLIWSYRTGSGITWSSPAIATDGTVYVGSTDNYFYALNSNGSLIWKMPTPDYIVSCPALDSAGVLYIGSRDYNMYAGNSSGGFVWSYTCNGPIHSSPGIGANKNICVGTLTGGTVYMLGEAPTSTPTGTPEATTTPEPTATPKPTATPEPTATPIPQAEIILNGENFGRGSYFTATFKLNESIERPFTAYAVVVLPSGGMINCLKLNKPLKPVVRNMQKLDAPFSYPLINRTIPGGAPAGSYEVIAGFFDPTKPIRSKEDAFLLASRGFSIQ